MARGSAEAAGPETGSERGGWLGRWFSRPRWGRAGRRGRSGACTGSGSAREGVLPGTWQDVSVALEISIIAENRITFLMTLRNSC